MAQEKTRNADILEVISVAKGGTGLSASCASGNVLTSDGSIFVSSPPAGAGGTEYIMVQLSSAQILDLLDTPVELIPAPGAGKVIIIERSVWHLDFNSIPYTGAGTYQFVYAGQTISLIEQNNLSSIINAIADAAGYVLPMPGGTSMFNITVGINAAVNARVTTEPITGNSPVNIHIWYSIVTL